jgi:two-component system, NtrC family, response regulator GlrR
VAPPGSRDPFDDATATLVGKPRRSQPLAALVFSSSAAGSTAPFRLQAGKCVVGSAAACDVVIADTTVSRTHVELELAPEGVRVVDLGSRNGTFYLGQRIEKAVLGLGARIQVGAATLAIDADTSALHDGLPYVGDAYRGMVGSSSAMRRIFALLTRLEGSLVTVLVEGESGVGKELIARALHDGSPIAAQPLTVVNCGAIARDLIASELFGHRKGAFTGAVESRKGAFETADGGTLFLDEIGELPLEVQPMLLRALESGEVRPVGEDQVRRVRVRVIAATNRDLVADGRAGRFREDLLYRLAVVRIRVPPLRERPEDVATLARRFADGLGLGELPAAVLERLQGRPWPGNARELKNAIQAYAALGVLPDDGVPSASVVEHALRLHADPKRPYSAQKDDLVDRFTAIYLAGLLEHTAGNQSEAARMAGLDRGYLRKLLAKHGLLKSGDD